MTWTLKISREEFEEFYGDTVDPTPFERAPTDDQDFMDTFLSSKLWRLNNLYTIVDKHGNCVKFNMNRAQHKVYAASLQHSRLIILKSRQQGISTFWLIYFLDFCIFMNYLTAGLMAQGLDEASTLLRRVKLAWDNFPTEIQEFLEISISRDNSSEVAFSNNSSLFIRTSFRSATLQGLHISEFGKIAAANPERAMETKTGTLQAIAPGNTTVIESTAEGDNEFKTMWDQAILAEARVNKLGLKRYAGKDFKPVFLSWLDDPDCVSDVYEEATSKQLEYFAEVEAATDQKLSQQQRNFWIAQARELHERIFQEYPATPEEAFQKTNEGTYYAKAYRKFVVQRGREISNLYDPNLPTYCVLDLGVNDLMVLLYFQRFRDEWRVVNAYSNSGEGLAHYVEHMNETGYDIQRVYCPHDIMVTELGTGKTRYTSLMELGVRNITVLPKQPVADGIEAFRSIIPYLYMDPACEYIWKCILNYSKEWDDRHNTWKKTPLHNEWSHGADACRYMAMSGARPSESKSDRKRSNHRDVVDGLSL